MSEEIKKFQERLAEIKAKKAELQLLEGKYQDDLAAFLKGLGLPEQFTILDIVKVVAEKADA